MGAAIRTYPWHETGLGPIDSWPVALRAVVQMMLQQKQSICLFWGPELRILYNDAYAPLLGGREPTALGQPFQQVWSDVWDELKPFRESALSGEGTFAEDLRLIMTRNGFEEETFWTFSYSPLYDDDGIVAGLINVAVDSTPTVVARRSHEVMQRELLHRVKNSLAVTSAIVNQSLRKAKSMEEARQTVTSRIQALSQAQELLAASAAETDIDTVVRAALAPHIDRTDAVTISGPNLKVSVQQAIGLSMVVYELATNAIKYGAFTADSGTIAIAWTHDDDGSFGFHWREQGGPAVVAPSATGFGSVLTNRIVGSYFNGSASTEYHPDGLRYDLNGRLKV